MSTKNIDEEQLGREAAHEYATKYVTGLEDLLREIMNSGSAVAAGEMSPEQWVALYRRAQVHLGDLTEEDVVAQND